MLHHLRHFPGDVPHHLPLPATHGLPHQPHITAPCTYTKQLLARLWSCSDRPRRRPPFPAAGSSMALSPVPAPHGRQEA